MQAHDSEISIKGRITSIPSILINNTEIIVTGQLIKTSRITEEWYEDVKDPLHVIEELRKAGFKSDIFTFWQRLPETKPKYNYHIEWDYIAAIPIVSFQNWFKKQIDTNARRAIKKAEKKGVKIEVVNFDDEFIKGMTDIFNETPIRQGKPFWHYGKDSKTVEREFSRYLYREDLIGAYYNGELIGFMFLAYAGKYAVPSQIISKIKHRDKSPNNALIAKAVEICDKKKIPYFVYFYWGDGTLAEFKRRNGFEKISLPRYYIPLTLKGKVILKLGLHKGIIGILPDKVLLGLKNLRNKFYTWKYKENSKTVKK